MINFDFMGYEHFHGKKLVSIKASEQTCFIDGGICFKKISFVFDVGQIIIEVNGNNDEIIVYLDLGSLPAMVHDADVLENYIGLELGWMWVSQNSQGYSDIVILSFSGPDPQLLFCGAGAMVHVYDIFPFMKK